MATELDLAAMAYGAYRPSNANLIPPSSEWTRSDSLSRIKGDAGFAADVITSASGEVVIAFRGTDGLIDSPAANIPAYEGRWSPQVSQAIELVSDVLAEHPDAQITFTGHSLGGGLASVMAIFFDRPAVVFDPAPFERSARGAIVDVYFQQYVEYQLRHHSGAPISEAEAQFSSYAQLNRGGETPGGVSEYQARELNVTGQFVSGEFLGRLREDASVSIGFSSTTPPVVVGTVNLPGIDAITLHSMSLLLGMRASEGLRQVSVDLPTLTGLLLSEELFFRDTASDSADLLVRLTRDQLAASMSGSGALDLLAMDLQAFGTQGATRRSGLQDGLISAVLERYYHLGATSNDRFITSVSNAIQFDLSELQSTVPLGPGRAALVQSVVALLSASDSALARSLTSTASVWTVQTGAAGLTTQGLDASEVQIGAEFQSNHLSGGAGQDLLINGNSGGTLTGGEGYDVLIGGDGSDTLYGGVSVGDLPDSDYLYGGAGNDTLIGGKGNDELVGGLDNDTYVFFEADGSDTVLDADGQGHIEFEGVAVEVGDRIAEDTWRTTDGRLTITRHPVIGAVSGTYGLTIRDQSASTVITVRLWRDNQLGLILNDANCWRRPAGNRVDRGLRKARELNLQRLQLRRIESELTHKPLIRSSQDDGLLFAQVEAQRDSHQQSLQDAIAQESMAPGAANKGVRGSPGAAEEAVSHAPELRMSCACLLEAGGRQACRRTAGRGEAARGDGEGTGRRGTAGDGGCTGSIDLAVNSSRAIADTASIRN